MIVNEFTVRQSRKSERRGREIVCRCDNPQALETLIKSHPQNFWLYHGEVVLEALGRLVEALQLNILGRVPITEVKGTTLVISA